MISYIIRLFLEKLDFECEMVLIHLLLDILGFFTILLIAFVASTIKASIGV